MDKLSIRKIYIDDFALKKREKYGTVMIDIESRKVVDILNSRDLEAVENFIKYEFSNGLAEGIANKIKVIKENI